MSEQIHAQEMVGKTVKSVHNGIEDLVIEFEDGTEYRQYVYTGNPRDL